MATTITPVTIANIALAELGAKRILNFEDGSKNAGLVSTFYDVAVEYTLTLHPWNFAIKRAKNLAARGTAPEWGWGYAYTYPTNALRVLAIGKDGREIDSAWEVELDPLTEERIIVTNVQAPLDVKYIGRITNSQLFSPPFVIALSKALKWMLALPITGKKDRKDESAQELENLLKRATSNDGQEGTPVDYGPRDLEVVR
jgi:hypothetical protein